MRTRMLLCALALAAAGGCKFLALPLLLVEGIADLVQPSSEAEEALGEKKVVVIAFAPDRILQYHPDIEHELASAVAAEMHTAFPKAQIVPADEVRRWKDKHPDWRGQLSSQAGKDLGGDFLVDLNILQFSTREGGGSMMMQGVLEAEAQVLEVSTGRRAWRLPPTRVRWPRVARHIAGDISEDALKQRAVGLFVEAFMFRFISEFKG